MGDSDLKVVWKVKRTEPYHLTLSSLRVKNLKEMDST